MSNIMVIYKPLYGESGTWVRPLSMWDNPIKIVGMEKCVIKIELRKINDNHTKPNQKIR